MTKRPKPPPGYSQEYWNAILLYSIMAERGKKYTSVSETLGLNVEDRNHLTLAYMYATDDRVDE